MIRYLGCLATLLVLGSPLRAGELDAEFGSNAVGGQKTVSSAKARPASLASLDRPGAVKTTELDAEAPVQAFHHGFGGFGGFHHGFGGFGGLGGFGGFGRGLGFGGFGGFGYGLGLGYGLGYGGFGYGLGLGYGLGYGYGGMGYGLGFGYGGMGYGGMGYGGMGYGGMGYGGNMPVAYYSPYMRFGFRRWCW